MGYRQFDAVLVAGEGRYSYKVMRRHKAFLEIGKRSVVSHVVRALQQCPSVRKIYLIGPREALVDQLRADGIPQNHPKEIVVLEQRTTLYENVWHAFMQSLPEPVSEEDVETSVYRDKAVLVVPCDAPLITPHEIEYFIRNADMERFDYVLGITPEEALRPFYPRKGQPGIKMAYLHLKENKFRINNLHLVKPARMQNRHYIQEMYQYRYQRDIKNVLRFGATLFAADKYKGYRYYICLLLGLMFAHLRLDFLVDRVRAFVPKKGLETWVSKGLKTRFTGLETPFPGATLDVDNNRDFEILKLRFEEWKARLKHLETAYPLPQPPEAPETPVPKLSRPAPESSYSTMDTEKVL